MRKGRSVVRDVLVATGMFILLVTMVSCGGQISWRGGGGGRYTSAAVLPPRPPTPTSPAPAMPPAKPESPGARIGLYIRFSEDWSSHGIHWQELWTVVQWQDNDGMWQDVEGWQGTLDGVEGGAGWKVWWLPEALLGRGPFRWMVYRPGDVLETQSEELLLPQRTGETVWVEVVVGP